MATLNHSDYLSLPNICVQHVWVAIDVYLMQLRNGVRKQFKTILFFMFYFAFHGRRSVAF